MRLAQAKLLSTLSYTKASKPPACQGTIRGSLANAYLLLAGQQRRFYGPLDPIWQTLPAAYVTQGLECAYCMHADIMAVDTTVCDTLPGKCYYTLQHHQLLHMTTCSGQSCAGLLHTWTSLKTPPPVLACPCPPPSPPGPIGP